MGDQGGREHTAELLRAHIPGVEEAGKAEALMLELHDDQGMLSPGFLRIPVKEGFLRGSPSGFLSWVPLEAFPYRESR